MPLIPLPDDYRPQAGDVLAKSGDYRRLYVDIVDAERCCYRLTDGQGGLLDAVRRTPEEFAILTRAQGAAIVAP
jgi:hypothetical protein